MRSSRAVWAAGAAVLIATSTVAVAGAFISTTGPGVIKLDAAPPSVALNALQHATSAVTFDEAQGRDACRPSRGRRRQPGYLHDVSATSGAKRRRGHRRRQPPRPQRSDRRRTTRGTRTGSVTFADNILGIVASTTRLANSDAGARCAGHDRTRAPPRPGAGSKASRRASRPQTSSRSPPIAAP